MQARCRLNNQQKFTYKAIDAFEPLVRAGAKNAASHPKRLRITRQDAQSPHPRSASQQDYHLLSVLHEGNLGPDHRLVR